MIRLHQYPAAWGLPSLSPFCLKVEAFCRINEIPFETVVEFNPRRGPKGKMPFIEDGATIVADSSFIVDYLRRKHRLPAPPPAAHAYRRLIEESLYWVLLYSRWVDDAGWPHTRDAFAPLFPYRSGALALRAIRYQLRRQAHQQGIGRHSRAEAYRLGEQDVDALATALGKQTTFMGIDETVYAFLQTCLKTSYLGPLHQAVRARGNLVDYCAYWEEKLRSGTSRSP